MNILKIISSIFSRKKNTKRKYVMLEVFESGKHYDEMNRNERRRYARWLSKRGRWDGAMVLDNMEKISEKRFGKK